MPLAYVTIAPSLDAPSPSTRVYALLLPTASDEWPELSIRHSSLGGFGVWPARKSTSGLNWPALTTPVVLPYLGAETVTKDAHSLKALMAALNRSAATARYHPHDNVKNFEKHYPNVRIQT